MLSSTEQHGEIKNPSSVINAKKQRKTIKWEKQIFIRETGNISCKNWHRKDRNYKDLTKAEEIKKKWQEYTQELYKKGFNDWDNHDGVVTHLEPDILESEVKWTLGSITTQKASGGNRIPAKIFTVLKVAVIYSNLQLLLKYCTQHVSTFGKCSSGKLHSTGKDQLSFQFQTRAMYPNYGTIMLISHASKVLLKILQAHLQQYANRDSRSTGWVSTPMLGVAT